MTLVVDDCPLRIAGFHRALGRGIAVAMNRSAAAHQLRTVRFTRIYLDYDGVDGAYLARMIVEGDLQPDAEFIIHSSNYPGARRMADILQDRTVTLSSYAEIVGADER